MKVQHRKFRCHTCLLQKLSIYPAVCITRQDKYFIFSQPPCKILKHLHTKTFPSSSQICGLHTNRIEELMRAFLADVFAETRVGLSGSTFNVTQQKI